MNRCSFSFFLNSKKAIVSMIVLMGAAFVVSAQSRGSFDDPAVALGEAALPRQFPSMAEKGTIRFVDPPEIVLDGIRLRIAPGARIKDQRNVMVHMSQLKGHTFEVMYLRDTMQQVGDIWLMTAYEISQLSPKQKREQMMRAQGYEPSREKVDPLLPYNKQPKY